MTKYIEFFKRYRLTAYEVEQMTLEELHNLKAQERATKDAGGVLSYLDIELRKTVVTQRLLREEYNAKYPEGFKLSQFKYCYSE